MPITHVSSTALCCMLAFADWSWCMCRITDGTFGEAEYFQGLVDNVNDMSKSNDWFLLANDFASYMDAQKQVDEVSHSCRCTPAAHERMYNLAQCIGSQ